MFPAAYTQLRLVAAPHGRGAGQIATGMVASIDESPPSFVLFPCVLPAAYAQPRLSAALHGAGERKIAIGVVASIGDTSKLHSATVPQLLTHSFVCLQRFTGQALGIATGMVASIEGQAESARARGREAAAAQV